MFMFVSGEVLEAARVPWNCLLPRCCMTCSPDVEFKMHCRGVEIWWGELVGGVMTQHGIGEDEPLVIQVVQVRQGLDPQWEEN